MDRTELLSALTDLASAVESLAGIVSESTGYVYREMNDVHDRLEAAQTSIKALREEKEEHDDLCNCPHCR